MNKKRHSKTECLFCGNDPTREENEARNTSLANIQNFLYILLAERKYLLVFC